MKKIFYSLSLLIFLSNFITAQTTIDTIDVAAGWNLIGALSTGEIQSIINTEPPGIITASIFGYIPGGGYYQADSLKRGNGYWVKVSQAGKIIFIITTVQSPSDTLYVSTGWNLIGSLSTGDIQSIITTEPPGIITASIFGYNPGEGYYQADSLKRGKGYWVKVNQNGIIIINIDLTPQPPTSGTHIPSANGITWNWNAVFGATGYKWNITNDYSSAIDVGNTTSKSETGLSCSTGYTRYIWAYNSYGHSAVTSLAETTLDDPPEAPTAAAHDTSTVYIIWKWNSVFEATGYKWNTTNDFNTASDVGGDTSKLELGLNCNNQYTRYVWAYNACGNSSATALIQTTSQCLTIDSCGLPITDTRDAKIYNTVQISNQCWMAENLNIGTMISGSNDMTNNGIIEKYCYNNNSNNCNTYGGLYQWNEAMAYTLSSDSIPSGRKGICPIGWHLPSDGEWTMLTDYLGGLNVAGGKMKEVGTAHWLSPNTGATNSSGFTALGAGVRYYNGTFIIFNYGNDFWTTTQKDFVYPFKVWDRRLFHNSAIVERGYDFKTEGWSVRCIKDFISAPTARTHVPAETSIIWNWNPVTGATGYKWNIINDYSSATDMGTITSKLETGLK